MWINSLTRFIVLIKITYENRMPRDSAVQNRFEKHGETSENIEFIYFKLPFLLKDRYTDRKKLL